MEQFLLNYKPKPESKTNTETTNNTSNAHTPWVEKYRPKSIDDIVYQDEVVGMLKKCISGSDFPNLLFYGPPGTGKTSTILATAKELFGPQYFRSRVLELNASDERGISVIREKVKQFSQYAASEKVNGNDGKNIPGFKLVILDEADSMTSAAQAALRRTMEVECKSTRFCLISNYVTRIIDPLTSRCAKFRFKTLDKEVAISRLMEISEAEGIKVSKEVLLNLIELAEGDLRRSITMLQSSSLLANNGIVNKDLLTEVAGIIPISCIEQFVQAIRSNSFDKVQGSTKKLLASGYAVAQIISQLHDLILNMDIKDSMKAILLEKLAISDEQLMGGADEYLQLMSISCFMMKRFAEI